jgi:hypothetical protein
MDDAPNESSECIFALFSMQFRFTMEAGRHAMAKKLHIEITPANWERMKEYVDLYNGDPARITPRYKAADVINQALHDYLSTRRK